MALEIKTLYLVSISVGVLIGLLLLIAWLQQRSLTALAWWGGAMVLVGVGLALIGARGLIHHVHSIAIGNALIALAVAAIWTDSACRAQSVLVRTVRRPYLARGLPGPILLWLDQCAHDPDFGDSRRLHAAHRL
jgi:hypothetical protein